MIDTVRWIERFREQDELVLVPDAVAADRLAGLSEAAERLEPQATRMYVPFVRRAGTVGAVRLRREAPAFAELYRELREVASALAGRPLFEKDADDDHAFALYCYREGDFMASHFDRCGDQPFGSYSVTVGIVDTSTSQLECKISRGRAVALATGPGSLTVYNGSRVAHAVTPLGRGQRRIVLSGSYRTQPEKARVPHLVQRVVEGALYFGWPGRERQRNRSRRAR
jgi:hypothetical protein